MAQPKKRRRITCDSIEVYFRSRGVPLLHALAEAIIRLDETEAVSLVDCQGLWLRKKAGATLPTFG